MRAVTPRVGLWLVLLVTVLVYVPIVHYGWVYEDLNVFPLSGWPMANPLYTVIYAPWKLADVLGSGHPWAYHAVALTVHCVNVALIYGIGRALKLSWGAVFAAALFALHPMQVETVSYAAAGRELVAGLWFLLALWIGIAGTARPILSGLAVSLCLAIAVHAKASEIMALVLVPFALALVAAWQTLAVVGIGGLAIVALRWPGIHHLLVAHDGTRWASFDYLATQATALLRYIPLLIWPEGMTVDHDWWILTAMGHALAFLLFTFLLVAVLSCVMEYPVFATAAVWVVVAFLPRFVLQTREILNEHQWYPAMIGVALACGIWSDRYLVSERI